MMFGLPLFVDNSMAGIVLTKEEERKQQLLNAALRCLTNQHTSLGSNTSEKGRGAAKGVMGKALLFYWLPQFILQAARTMDKCICLSPGYPPREGEKAPLGGSLYLSICTAGQVCQ